MTAPIERDTLIEAIRALASLARVEFGTMPLSEAADLWGGCSEYEIDALRLVESSLLAEPLNEVDRVLQEGHQSEQVEGA
jgi:hypothetical protein